MSQFPCIMRSKLFHTYNEIDENSSHVSTDPPKPSRRFSLGGLLRRRHRHEHAMGDSSAKLKRALSLTGTSAVADGINVTSRSDYSNNRVVKRTNSLAATVGKFFRRKSDERQLKNLQLDDKCKQKSVSSLYTQQVNPQIDTQMNSSKTTLAHLSVSKSRESTPVTSGEITTSSIERNIETKTIMDNAIRVITSSRCVFTLASRLIQGTMVLSTKGAVFTASTMHPHLLLNINYPEIVAIIPYGDRTGMRIATQTKCLYFQGFPHRDEFLGIFMKLWTDSCKRLLLDENQQHHSKKLEGNNNNSNNRTAMRKSLDQTVTLEPPSMLRRVKSMSRTPVTLPKRVGPYPCGCLKHYQNDITEIELKGTPLAIANVLFGLGGSRVSYAGTYFSARGGTTIEETPWTIADGIRHRLVIANVPDAFRPTSMMRIENTQRLVVETADKMVMEAELLLKQTSFGKNYQCYIKWCIVREKSEERRSTIRITAEIGTVGPVALPVRIVEDRLVEYAKRNFVEMLEILRVRFEITAAENKEPVQEELLLEGSFFPWRNKMGDVISELLFIMMASLQRWVGENYRKKRYKYRQVILGLIISFPILIILKLFTNWYLQLMSSSATVIPAELAEETRAGLLQNASEYFAQLCKGFRFVP